LTTVPRGAVARVLDEDGPPVGAAFPVTDDHLVTAAHVVNAAVGVPFETET
jgi:hypothetical protein